MPGTTHHQRPPSHLPMTDETPRREQYETENDDADGGTEAGSDRKLTCEEVRSYLLHRPPVGTMEVAEAFDVSHMTARRRLNELVEDDRVMRTKVHHSMVVWWIPDWLTPAPGSTIDDIA